MEVPTRNVFQAVKHQRSDGIWQTNSETDGQCYMQIAYFNKNDLLSTFSFWHECKSDVLYCINKPKLKNLILDIFILNIKINRSNISIFGEYQSIVLHLNKLIIIRVFFLIFSNLFFEILFHQNRKNLEVLWCNNYLISYISLSATKTL